MVWYLISIHRILCYFLQNFDDIKDKLDASKDLIEKLRSRNPQLADKLSERYKAACDQRNQLSAVRYD